MTFPLNIYFYWDKNIPKEVKNNIKKYKKYNPNYNIVVLNDEIINSYIEDFPELI